MVSRRKLGGDVPRLDDGIRNAVAGEKQQAEIALVKAVGDELKKVASMCVAALLPAKSMETLGFPNRKPAVNNSRIRINMLCSQVGTALPRSIGFVEFRAVELGFGGNQRGTTAEAIILRHSFTKI